MRRRGFNRAKAGQRGSVLIEFALSFLVLFAIFTGAFEFGYAFYAYNTLENAVREGARYASMKPYDSATSTPANDFNTAVQNMVVYSNPSPANNATPILRGLSTSNVNLSVSANGGSPTQMTVSISNFSIDAVFGTVVLNGNPSVSFPYLGIPTPPSS
ncbi:MAG TPA: TadE/TadG family type IV pilus assembly protein [Bryobacteraceae bacterium]|jgi:Flp pilus assembly protein TadG|nr:TadE/TadG family type IV pilus assembly protein [Bryobacteraceae bacterium]